MKRRLDLALALAHRPRILFLDEPTTGLDIQSRTALWDEVARLAAEDGVTVFLTTQYLEEADALADRVGIIDHGHIVAEGTPAELKAEIGRPTVEAVPRDPGDRERDGRGARALRRARRRRPDAASPCASRAARRSWPRWSARSTPRGSRSSTCSCTRPRSTTSSSPRPAARWRAPARRGGDRRSREPRRSPGVSDRRLPHPGRASSPAARCCAPCASRRRSSPRSSSRSSCSRSTRAGSKTRPTCPASRPTPTSPSPSPSPSSRGRCSR